LPLVCPGARQSRAWKRSVSHAPGWPGTQERLNGPSGRARNHSRLCLAETHVRVGSSEHHSSVS
jgi:hypothetical protein